MSVSPSQFIVLTTINPPTLAIEQISARSDWKLLVIGDNKTPADWSCDSVDFIGIEEQRSSTWQMNKAGLPENHYCRKNLGYLEAISRGATVIAETDDDNLPNAWPPSDPARAVTGPRVFSDGWINIYPYFTEEKIWPRGYPLQLISDSFTKHPEESGIWDSAIHQYLASGDPDVDAIYRMTVNKNDHIFKDTSIVLGRQSLTTFNSQCTVWFPEAFPLLYLPSFVSFRMTDIWRSLVAQVCLWAMGSHLAYHGYGVTQVRNEHDLMRDFSDEVAGYEKNTQIAQTLLQLRLETGVNHAPDNLRACYVALRSLGVIPEREMPLVDAWVDDMSLAARV